MNPAERLATIASFFAKQNYRDDSSWITTKISELCSKIEAGKLSVSSILASIVTLNELGYLNSHAGKELVIVLKTQVMSDSGDIDVFETLASMIDIFPQSFTEEDLESIRVEYSDYAERYAAECDLTNPDELREEASRIQDIGDFFEVDTDATQDTLREFADEIEEKQQSEWDNFDEDDRSSTHINSPDECSDRELDSIFSTLGN